MLEPQQCKAARALLDMTQEQLGRATNLSPGSIRSFERRNIMRPSNRKLLRLTFEAEGIQFIDSNGGGPGARLRAP